ncbi:30S ribosomal protein S21, chloroplastic-like isoform X1 [Zingiber officinale]|uniref:Ribosomal protein S21 n=1 Tax=Zingiber officinale TaxID=94328 RepID=A0A8J5H5V7_ZINOF|nr:30S ribosomal protein S21, chloroplastic-like isoform X1 [Zingiber officinale]KAG6512914.1 hypothetical protein ZIOFF_031053 [Zingiber officinale]
MASLALRGLLSSLPPLPLSTKKNPSPHPPLLSSLLPLRSIQSDAGFLPRPINSASLVRPSSAGEAAIVGICFPALAWANVLYAKGGNYNAQVVIPDDEPDESLLRRFKREVMKAGVLQECKRRRWFENTVEKKKRKVRDAARKNRKWRYIPKVQKRDNENEPSENEQGVEVDNWELPEGEIPYCDKIRK